MDICRIYTEQRKTQKCGQLQWEQQWTPTDSLPLPRRITRVRTAVFIAVLPRYQFTASLSSSKSSKASGRGSVDDADGQRELLSFSEADFAVDIDAVVLDGKVVFERHLGPKQMLERLFGLAKFRSQLLNRLRDLIYLFHQTNTHTHAHTNLIRFDLI